MGFRDLAVRNRVRRGVVSPVCLVLTLGVVLEPDLAQAQTVEWVQSAGGTGALAIGRGISVDATGNSHVTGFATTSVMFGLLPVTSGGFFVAKYDPEGYLLWVRSATQSASAGSEGSAVATDLAGNSYITGYFVGTMIVGESTFSGLGGADVFVAKYDSAGNVLWARSAGSAGYDTGNGIAVDAAGNAYVAGEFSDTVSFGETTLTSAGVVDVFVAKYDPEGNLLWARSGGGTSDDVGLAIACDTSGNCFLTGMVTGTATFGHITLSGSYSRIFLAKYDSGGNVIWVRVPEGSAYGLGYGIAVDAAGDPYLTGMFGYQDVVTILFDSLPLTSVGGRDVFLVKYDAAGSALWATSAGGTSDEVGFDVDVDSAGSSYVTGYFEGSMDIGSLSLSSAGDRDVFAAKYDSLGNLLWAESAGGLDEDQGTGIGVDDAGNAVVTGFFRQTAIFPPFELPIGGVQGLFVAKYTPDGACCNHATGAFADAGQCEPTTAGECTCPSCEWFKHETCDAVRDDGRCYADFVGVPTISEWGLVVLTLGLLTVGKIHFGRRSLHTL